MNKKQILSLILSLIMMLTIAFPVGVLADGEEGEPVEQEPVVVVEEQKDGDEQEPVQEETPEQPAADGEPEAEAPKGTITITTQPTSKTATAGEKVTLSVVATGTGLTYQWQRKSKTADDTAWGNASGEAAKSANWELTVVAAHYNLDFRCLITDANGNTETTNVVHIDPIGITTQPTDKIAAVGDKVTLSVVASGTGLTYQWQRKSKTATEWGNASGDAAKKASWQLTVVAAHYNLDFRCLITDANGYTVVTDTVNIYDMSHAEPFTVSGVTYLALSASTCKVVSYSGTASSLTIPGTAKGLTVVEIGEEAFMGNTTLTSIDLPDSITVIRARAFKGCTNLSDMH